MKFFPTLSQGFLIKRYKRFLADIETTDGERLTIHCPNTGSMKNCLSPGEPVWYSDSGNPKRKYRHTWEIATTPDGDLAGINTSRANALVEEVLRDRCIEGLDGWQSLRREVRYGGGSRADFCLWFDGIPCYVEVKNVTLLDGDQGYFPDAVSDRATRHLTELSRIVQHGGRAILIFCVQHSGIQSVSPAEHIDPLYAQALTYAADAGVEMYALKAHLSPEEIVLQNPIAVLDRSGKVISCSTGPVA